MISAEERYQKKTVRLQWRTPPGAESLQAAPRVCSSTKRR
jgi:hypothetical protein